MSDVDAYRVTLVVLDYNNIGEEQLRLTLEAARFLVAPRVTKVEERIIKDYDDGHPMNQRGADMDAEFEKLEAGK
jgi:hypothetical protein